MDLKDLALGMRVQIHPATDLFMRGVRFGDIVALGRKWVTLDVSLRPDRPRRVKIAPAHLLDVA
jgi:hypothetical protein